MVKIKFESLGRCQPSTINVYIDVLLFALLKNLLPVRPVTNTRTDDGRIKLSLQIYLSNNNEGTSLYDKDGNMQYTFPFKFNSGYALYNGVYSTHGVEEIVNDGRTSLYVRYQ